MDSLMQPVLDFDDNDEEEDIRYKERLSKENAEGKEGQSSEYSIEKYFSNGDVDRGHKGPEVFSKRNTRVRRYSGDQDDPNTGFGYNAGQVDSDEDELERGGDPLSLEELDGWMNEINQKRTHEDDIIEVPP